MDNKADTQAEMLTNTITGMCPANPHTLFETIAKNQHHKIGLYSALVQHAPSPGLQQAIEQMAAMGPRQTKALTAIAAKYEIEEDTSGMPTEETPKKPPYPFVFFSALEENLTWCDKVKQVLSLELQQICHLAQFAALAPHETARMMVLRFIGGELSEAEFWNSIFCNSCDTCQPSYSNGEQQPNLPTGINTGSDTFDGPGAIPAPGIGLPITGIDINMGPNTSIIFPELSASAKAAKDDTTGIDTEPAATIPMPPIPSSETEGTAANGEK